ncbi:fumarylacetoacetate hydrolase family protein [Pontibacter ramchanderi]|uniref:2-keto-4-pentenoate hydratase/2-oxohepta-3-ene-1,7-dioic acid hydratase in catechol pathway n=1 Tax=Pontibacter ramchanderi TaxID=1179743 RepID=A0A2N3U8E9_9BACT|nr:fumarylacetoacetate hydrolase family protein [Pontibacter ramchanderi]PKV63016.1 2-keto-4-pentenoate hydratase/2-oxohepta-3-ene-1,7-dioic acid hydratase in catechol pathway [Pontibacter ramchanderi]
MKILAIGRNYADHIAELKNEVPDEPVIFFKPDTAILKNNEPFYYPEYSQDIHHEVELILRVSREGKNIDKKFAHKYYDAIGLGIDFTARDLQAKAKAKGLPWTLAKGFNGSAPISEFLPLEQFEDLQDINFKLDVNGETRQQGNSKMMLNNFDDIIAYISRFITLKKGDIIFTGTPEGVGPVKIGDRLEGYVEDKKLLDFEIK